MMENKLQLFENYKGIYGDGRLRYRHFLSADNKKIAYIPFYGHGRNTERRGFWTVDQINGVPRKLGVLNYLIKTRIGFGLFINFEPR